ncbi:MAG: DUF4260 domain-containing protein, partial [Candidatus Limnocylindria bacterium]
GLILRAEHVAMFAAGVAAWLARDGSLLFLVPALIAPDLSAIGYLGGPRLGAVTYNAAHNLVTGLAVVGLGWWLGIEGLVLAGAILVAHVGMDRTLGFGLKRATSFNDTHLGPIGRSRP